MRIPCKTRSQKRARKSNPLRAAKLVAKREVPAVKVFRSGREVCSKTPEGRAEYLKRLDAMVERQSGVCGCGCNQGLYDPTFDHENGRGHGGGKRDDRIILPDGTIQNRALNGVCNVKKASVRGYETTVRRTMRTTI